MSISSLLTTKGGEQVIQLLYTQDSSTTWWSGLQLQVDRYNIIENCDRSKPQKVIYYLGPQSQVG